MLYIKQGNNLKQRQGVPSWLSQKSMLFLIVFDPMLGVEIAKNKQTKNLKRNIYISKLKYFLYEDIRMTAVVQLA